MGKAREIMDQVTAAMFEQKSLDSTVALYDEDATILTPDAGEVRGRAEIADYWRQFIESFPDGRFEPAGKYETGDSAIDEGWFVGTNTAPLRLPNGETMPATGRQVKVRSCDVANVQRGKIKEHHLYFDQLEFLDQLGLRPPAEPTT